MSADIDLLSDLFVNIEARGRSLVYISALDICLLTSISQNEDPPTHESQVSSGNFDTNC